MKNIHPLTKWVINKIENEYKDDVALLIGIKGHSTDRDCHGECFDFFVPYLHKTSMPTPQNSAPSRHCSHPKPA